MGVCIFFLCFGVGSFVGSRCNSALIFFLILVRILFVFIGLVLLNIDVELMVIGGFLEFFLMFCGLSINLGRFAVGLMIFGIGAALFIDVY